MINLDDYLKRDRLFEKDNDSDGPMLEELVSELIENTSIYFIRSNLANHLVVKDGIKNIIVWDTFYWELFEKHVALVQLARTSEKNDEMASICQLMLSNFSFYLARKYERNNDLSIALLIDAIRYGYEEFNCFDFAPVEIDITICKLFTLFHEMAHINFSQDKKTKTVYYNYVRKNIFQNDYKELFLLASEFFPIDESFVQTCVEDLLNGKNPVLLEELAADHFALFHTFNFISTLKIIEPSALAILFKDALMALIDFNDSMNVLKSEWDYYNAAISLKVTNREFFSDRIQRNRLATNQTNLFRDNFSHALMLYELSILGQFDDESANAFFDDLYRDDDTELFDRYFSIALRNSLWDDDYITDRVLFANVKSQSNTPSYAEKLALKKRLLKKFFKAF